MSDWRESAPGYEAPGWPPAGAAPATGSTYLPLGRLGAWIFWLLLVMAATYAVTTALTLVARGVSGYSTAARIDRFGGTDVALTLIGVVQSALFLAAAVLFIIWFYRAYENLRPLAAPEPRRGSGWTIGAWFLPILDLVLPKLMLNETWRGGEPDLARDPSEVRIPAFHHLWWAIWVAAFVLAVIAGVEIAISGFESGLSGDPSTSVSTLSAALTLVSGLLNAVAAALGALVVRRTTERQESRRERLGAARPAAEGLTR